MPSLEPARAVIWDFGGVIVSSPFDSFARYEERNGLPPGLLRTLNATNPDTNAWAQMERSEITMDRFFDLYEEEANAAGHQIDARAVLSLLAGELRPEMVEAVRRCSERIPTALITNNFVRPAGEGRFEGERGPRVDPAARPEITGVYELFHVVIESSKAGVRKPDPRIYEMACEALGVKPPDVVMLDDLGINLKPARAMGMRTIKVTDPAVALDELEATVGFPVRSSPRQYARPT